MDDPYGLLLQDKQVIWRSLMCMYVHVNTRVQTQDTSECTEAFNANSSFTKYHSAKIHHKGQFTNSCRYAELTKTPN